MRRIRHEAPLGRRAEFDRAIRHLTPGAGVLVRGGAGTGRTTFATALAEAARRDGGAPLWITPTPSLRAVPFGALCSVLDRTAGAQPVAALLSAAVDALRFHGGAAPTALVIDDAHLLDEHSADAVLQAVGSRAVTVVATVDPNRPLPGALRRLIDDRFVEVIDLAPFDRAVVAEVVAAMLDGSPAESTVELLWRWSAGMPSLLAAIVETGRRDGRFEPAEGQWWWHGAAPTPDLVTTWTERRLADLGDAATDALGMVALAGWLAVGDVEALAGVTALVELEDAGLIETCEHGDGLVVHCDDELVAPVLVSRLAALRRRRLARRLLGALPAPRTPAEVARSAGLHLHTGESVPSEVMVRAASVVRLSDPLLARRIAEVNHRWSPSVASIVSLLMNHIELGDVDGARPLLAQARARAASDDERTRVVEAEFALRLFGDRDPAAATAVLGPGGEPSLASLAALLGGQPDRAGELARAAVTANGSSDVARLRAGVSLVASRVLAGRTAVARDEAAVLLPIAAAFGDELPAAAGMLRAALAFIALWRGELTPVPSAHPATGRWPSPPALSGSPDAEAGAGTEGFRWALMAGIVAQLRGDHTEAIARLHEAVVQQSAGKGIFHAEASAWLVVALCDGGSRAEADSALGKLPDRHLAILPGLANWARGVVACAHGRLDDGARLLALAAAEAAAVGAFLCEVRYLLELVERCDTDAPIGRLDELSRVVDAPMLQLMCRTAIARLKGDVDALLTGAEALARAGLRPRASVVYREAERLARASGDTAAARRAAQLRRRLGDAPGAADGDGHPLLTAREHEVASLAAGGLADRQIAARLVVSVRTVESHLASVYRKLGISSRAALGDGLGVLSRRR